ncbi:uncharacterized protein LOC113308538 isoform X2 [Papaver somniferum]|uniref:uncharacterized protein LOC113308538 isoform X2 n=1 Tax=Papaver somniferum TaxID=3469 RepID=UPI000E6F5400|nr:uncharacterized protein LOC113308538 isoform X2 [Papaver somniferum]
MIAQAANIEYMISIDEIDTGKGLNHMGNLQRPADTRWGSHIRSVSSLIDMFSATCQVLINVIQDGSIAYGAYENMTTFEFVFILHLMRETMTMTITDLHSQALQYQSQYIVNAMELVSSTKALLQNLRDDGPDKLITEE